jgi:predicted transcriptional regulator
MEDRAMTIELSPELEERLRAAAERQGVAPEKLALNAIEEKLPPDPMKRVLWNGMTVEEWIRETRAWVESRPPGPSLPDEAFSRESMYEDERL